MDIQKSIRMAVDSGKVEFGERSGRRFALKGGAKLILISKNCPKERRDNLAYLCDKSKISYLSLEFTSLEIGSICGKPYSISVLSIIEPGNSDILEVKKMEKIEEGNKEEKKKREEKKEGKSEE